MRRRFEALSGDLWRTQSPQKMAEILQAAFIAGWNTSNIAPPRTWGARLGFRF
jgi:hypothetical protein